MKFAIRNAGKADSSVSSDTFDSLEAARDALREALGWADVQLGRGYTGANTKAQIWCAYRTRQEAERDANDLGAPRIVRVLEPD
jgi:hypothetical protein